MSSQPGTADTGVVSLESWNMCNSPSMISGALDDIITVTVDPSASPGYLYTTAITGASNGASWTQPAPKLTLNGEDADIEINGVSLTETLKGLQDRLNILRPNEDLESRWEELRQARERYQQLEREIIEKERAWNALQQQG